MPAVAVTLVVCAVVAVRSADPAEWLPGAAPHEVGMSAEPLRTISDVMHRRVADGDTIGASVLVSRRGKVVYFEQFGVANREARGPMRPDTIARIYSMTKAITSTAALLLRDEGKLSLDDPVERFLPELAARLVHDSGGDRPAQTTMTIRHLMLHTSGLIYGRAGGTTIEQQYDAADLLNKNGTLQDLVDKLSRLPLAFDPGMKREYGLSTDVLGAVVERASGQTLAEFFRERIFEPLKMVDTGFEVPPHKIHRFAGLYERRNGRWRLSDAPATSRFSRPATLYSGGGGLVSTAPDYWRFLMMIAGGGEIEGRRLLQASSVHLLTHNQLDHGMADPGQGYGLGFRVLVEPIPLSDKHLLGEYWWFGRASTHNWTNPREKLTVILFEQRIPSADIPFDATYAEVHPLVYAAVEPGEE